MLRIFTSDDLEKMCAVRPAGYREDMLEVSNQLPDGRYELDTESAGYAKLRTKYLAPPRRIFEAEARHRAERSAETSKAATAALEQLKVVPLEPLYSKGTEIIKILGGGSRFATVYNEVKALEARGGCRSCSRRRHLTTVADALVSSLYIADIEVCRKVREIFPGSIYIRLVPAPLKWDDILTKPRLTSAE
jgi:hypothetical protein